VPDTDRSVWTSHPLKRDRDLVSVGIMSILHELADGHHLVANQFLADQLEQTGARLERNTAISRTDTHVVSSFQEHVGSYAQWPRRRLVARHCRAGSIDPTANRRKRNRHGMTARGRLRGS